MGKWDKYKSTKETKWDKYKAVKEEPRTKADYILPAGMTKYKEKPGERTLMGDIFDRPGAALRSQLQGTGYMKGVMQPETIPKFQDLQRDRYWAGKEPGASKDLTAAGGMSAETRGMAMDVATNPADLFLMLVGKLPLGKGRTVAGQIAKTRPGQALGRFGTRQRSLKTGEGLPGGNLRQAMDQGAPLAQEMRAEFVKVQRNLTDKFGSQLEELAVKNPTKTVSLSGIIDDIANNVDDMSTKAQAAIRRIKPIKDMIKNPKSAEKVTLRKVQDIINEFNTKIPRQIRATDIDTIHMLNEVKAAQLDAFPEMSEVRAAYAAGKGPINNVKNYFKFNKLLKAIETDFGGPEGMAAVKSIVPKQVLRRMGGYKSAAKSLKITKYVAKELFRWVIIFGIGGAALKGVLSGMDMGGGGTEGKGGG